MNFKKLSSVLVAAGLAVALVGCGDKKAETAAAPAAGAAPASVTLTVGASPVPHADILKVVAPKLEKEGVKLKVIEFSDYIKPNLSLADKELDANFFQHKPYLDEFAKSRNLKLESLVAVHLEPMGLYSAHVKKVADIKDGATVAIPNDPTNGGRALKVLESAGLIKVKPEAGVLATVADVTDNPKHLKFAEIEAAQLPRALPDVDAAVINSNFALGAKLNPTKDAIAIESKESPYANIVAIRAGDNRPELQKLKAALTSQEVKDFINKTYEGAVVPAF